MTQRLTDQDVAWCTERVQYYIRRGFMVPQALERAMVDFRARV